MTGSRTPLDADSIVDELTRGDPDPGRLRAFVADPRGFEGNRFGAASSSALAEAVRQIEEYLGGGKGAPLSSTRPAASIPELDVPLEPPARIGRYQVETELGRGGFGVVYRGWDSERNRPVAIKVLRRRTARMLEGRFYDEAWVAKGLPPHPNLVGLLDVGIDEHQGPYLVHEFVPGHDLAEHPLPMGLAAARRCLREIAAALSHLHAHRIIHRDLKPSNVRLLADDPAAAPESGVALKVLDLGIAALLSEEIGGRRTQPGSLLGTLRYMAPEQLQRLPVDERTDVYALGLVAFEILTGSEPFEGVSTDPMERLRSQFRGPRVARLSKLPDWLRQLVVACLAFERSGRPDGCDEVLRALHLEQPPRIALRSRERAWRAQLAVFPPPPVGDINPYRVLHLQRGEVGERWDFEARLPPYVRRDVDAELDALLERDQPLFLLLAGPSKCGKSRTAFEALARNLPRRALLLPARLEDVEEVLTALPQLEESWPRPILWLDNVHEHLRAQSLPSGPLQQALDAGVVVVATIWDSELRSLAGLGATGADTGLDTAMLRAAREVLQHARIVRLEAAISVAERRRAEGLYPDLTFDAGLGETFVARGLLLQRFDNGSRELRALVWALVDCARAGLLDGTPLPVLREIMPAYLALADPGAWIRPARAERLLRRALEQGTEPVGVHQRLVLHVGNDTFKVYDPVRYHVEHLTDRSRALPPALWRAVLGATGGVPRSDGARSDRQQQPGVIGAAGDEFALARRVAPRPRLRVQTGDTDTADFLEGEAAGVTTMAAVNWVVAGLTAWETGDPAVAEEAYRTGMAHGSAAAACSLGLLLESTGDREGAEGAYRTAIERGDPNAAFHLALLRGEPALERPDQPPIRGGLGVGVRQRRDVTVLDLEGTLTLGGGYQALHQVIHREIDRGGQRFLLQLRAVTAIDPAGVGALVGALTAAVHRGRALSLCSVPPEIVETLATHGLIRIFKIFDDEELGLAALATV